MYLTHFKNFIAAIYELAYRYIKEKSAMFILHNLIEMKNRFFGNLDL